MKSIAEISDDISTQSARCTLDHFMVTDWAIRGDKQLMALCEPYLRSGRVTDEALRILWQHAVRFSEAESLLIDLECQRAAGSKSPRWAMVASQAHNGSQLERVALLMHHLSFSEQFPPQTARSRCVGAFWAFVQFLNTPVCQLKFKRS